MKIVATLHHEGAACHIPGAPVTTSSAIIDIPEDNIPPLVRKYLSNPKWTSITFSLLDERGEEEG